ncbi:auxin-responsive protein IAA29-like [Euphorbia lathyris]|uniref:auxin-responsive protein IAA29-like n=1 Tax=Euphorbia lathyris TaxID=212925 RepID=UPI003313AB6C
MELQLGLSLSNSTCTKFSDDDFTARKKQRSVSYSNYASESDDDQVMESRTLPLFLWSNQPNQEDDDPKHSDNSSSSSSINQEEDDSDDGIVGWPPIKFRRRKMRQTPTGGNINGCADCHSRVSNSMYVKVKMEGVAIARKIDLTIYDSFQQLKQILISMFGIFQENSTSYELTYQDKEGDWMLAENVSWRSFMGSVQRLKLIRSSSC